MFVQGIDGHASLFPSYGLFPTSNHLIIWCPCGAWEPVENQNVLFIETGCFPVLPIAEQEPLGGTHPAFGKAFPSKMFNGF